MQTPNKDQSIAILNRRWLEVAVFLLIVAVGVGSRFWLADFPNFKPVAALCLFAGFFFRSYAIALVALVSVLLISDWQLGSYQWQVALAVYGSMAIACSLGWLIKKRLSHHLSGISGRQLGGFVLSSLIMSTTFFVFTNFAVWQFCGWYAGDPEGCIACFSAAIPFYRWTLMGDLTFTLVIVGVYQTACIAVFHTMPQMLTTEH